MDMREMDMRKLGLSELVNYGNTPQLKWDYTSRLLAVQEELIRRLSIVQDALENLSNTFNAAAEAGIAAYTAVIDDEANRVQEMNRSDQ